MRHLRDFNGGPAHRIVIYTPASGPARMALALANPRKTGRVEGCCQSLARPSRRRRLPALASRRVRSTPPPLPAAHCGARAGRRASCLAAEGQRAVDFRWQRDGATQPLLTRPEIERRLLALSCCIPCIPALVAAILLPSILHACQAGQASTTKESDTTAPCDGPELPPSARAGVGDGLC